MTSQREQWGGLPYGTDYAADFVERWRDHHVCSVEEPANPSAPSDERAGSEGVAAPVTELEQA